MNNTQSKTEGEDILQDVLESRRPIFLVGEKNGDARYAIYYDGTLKGFDTSDCFILNGIGMTIRCLQARQSASSSTGDALPNSERTSDADGLSQATPL